jgi:hypothetical protein
MVMIMLIVLPVELDILREMQPLDRDVFHYLAERMDIQTGVTGVSRRVSYGGIAFDLSEREGERRSPETLRKLSIDQVRNAVRRLVKRGILRGLSEKGKGNDLVLMRIFWVDCLGLGSCVQKADASSLPDQMATVVSFLHSKINSLQSDNASSCQAKTRPDAITSITHQQQQADVKFTMSLDWRPTADEFEAMLFRAGKRVDAVQDEWVAEFVAYWFGEGKRQYSQREWTARLAMRVVDLLRDPGRFARERGGQQVSRSTAQPSRAGLPEWAKIPRNDDDLTSWAMRHGYGAADIGWSWLQYRGALQCAVEARLKQWRQLS